MTIESADSIEEPKIGLGLRPSAWARMIAVNVRCLDNIDLEKVPTKAFDGKSL